MRADRHQHVLTHRDQARQGRRVGLGDRRLLHQELGIAANGVERRSQIVAQTAQAGLVAAAARQAGHAAREFRHEQRAGTDDRLEVGRDRRRAWIGQQRLELGRAPA
jgi:hypothetical protein